VWTNPGGVIVASASSNRWGGTVGIGWEYGFAPNWSFGIEYDRLFMGDSNNSFSGVPIDWRFTRNAGCPVPKWQHSRAYNLRDKD
jgi:opacity protein-like surface antigen